MQHIFWEKHTLQDRFIEEYDNSSGDVDGMFYHPLMSLCVHDLQSVEYILNYNVCATTPQA
jgi:hypothetical protein